MANRNQTNTKRSISSKSTVRHEKQICCTSKHSHKEAKNYKEKEILIHRHQTPVYRKRNHRPNPVINHFPENDYPFSQQRTDPGNSKYSFFFYNDLH